MGSVNKPGRMRLRETKCKERSSDLESLIMAMQTLDIAFEDKSDERVIRRAYAKKMREIHPDTALNCDPAESSALICNLKVCRDILLRATLKNRYTQDDFCRACGGSGFGKGFASRCPACAGTGKSRSKVK